MKRCENCIHFSVCYQCGVQLNGLTFCGNFKDKSEYQEIIHGHWIDNHNGTFKCSVCEDQSSKMNWCGRCGAKMDKEVNNA